VFGLEKELLKARGKQRTDSTHILAAIRVMNRLEMVVETMRAALNQLAAVEPDWLAQAAKPEWFDRYAGEPNNRGFLTALKRVKSLLRR
jgi:transposase